jgi:amidase
MIAALDDGRTTSVALVEDALARIEAAQPTINAFRLVRTEAALCRRRRSPPGWCPWPSVATAPGRCGSPRPGPGWSASSLSGARISTWPDSEAFNGLTCFGPLARTVDDAARLLDVLSGSHPGDTHKPPPPDAPFVELAAREPGRLRIAVSYGAPFSGVRIRLDPEIRAAVRRLADVLDSLGHDVFEAEVPYGPVGPAFVPRGVSGVGEWERRVPDPSLLDPRTRIAACQGRAVYRHILRPIRASEPLVRRWVGRIFDRADVVLAPTTAQPPLRAGAFDGLSHSATDMAMTRACPYGYAWNVTGWPASTYPPS